MKLWTAVTVAAGVVMSSPAHGQSWQPVNTDKDGAIWSIDQSSLVRSGSASSAWIKVLYPTPQWLSTISRYYLYSINRVDFDCASDTFTIQSSNYYSEQDNIVTSFGPNASGGVTAAAPGTIANGLLQRACTTASTDQNLAPTLTVGPKSAGIDWRADGTDEQGSTYSTTYKLFDPGKGDVYYFSKIEFKSPQTSDGRNYSNLYMIVDGDCKRHRYAILTYDAYDASGNLTSTYAIPKGADPKYSAIAPSSAADAQLKRYCKQSQANAEGSDADFFTGTAWEGPKGYLITAAHVVAGASTISLAQSGKFVGTAEVLEADPANDVAVLRPKFTDGAHPALPLSETPTRLGEQLFTLGYPVPDQMGLSLKVTSGEVSALSGVDVDTSRTDDLRLLQISAPIQSGNSGGPVFDNEGRVIGIVEAKFQLTAQSEITQNVNYALKIAYVRPLIDSLPDIGGYTTPPAAASRVDAIAGVQRGVFLVVASRPKP